MEVHSENPADEITRLQRSMNDLVSVLALPAIWSGGDPTQIVRTLLDVLISMLHLDLIYARLNEPAGGAPIETVRFSQTGKLAGRSQGIGQLLDSCLGNDPLKWPAQIRNRLGDADISIVPLRLGINSEIGFIAAGSQRADFPDQIEKLLLGVAANQAAIALQEARLLGDTRRVANQLERRVAERTAELASTNKELKLQVGLLQESQDDLRRAEEKTRLIIDTTLDAAITMDGRGMITNWNRQAEVIFGWTEREAIGRHMSEMIIPEQHRVSHERGLRHFLATGDGPILRRHIEFTALRRSGVEFPVELEVTPVKVSENWVFSGFIRDITNSKLAENKLQESEFNLRQMTETIPEMLWSATAEGAIDYCNARLLHYTGLTADQIMGNGWTKLFHPGDIEQAARTWLSCVASGAPYRVEVRTFHAADRSYRWCVMNALPLVNQQGRILRWHGTVVDMHDWKESQDELRRAQAELAYITRVLTIAELTASIAHEVNQPLAGIITNAGTCLRMLAADPPNIDGARETARRTIRDGNRASDVITRLRALFSKRDVAAESVDLNDATQEVIALSLSEIQRNDVILRSELADNLPFVTGDRVQLQQVILNLLRNASDAMSGINDRPRRLLIRTERDGGDRVRLTVRDSGIGFDPQVADRLFKAFYTTKGDGMGMGLSVSRSIIEQHKGNLWAKLNDGPGATFSFSVPCGREALTSAGNDPL